MSYESYFDLREQPFSNSPDSRFFYAGQQHSEAMLRLMHAAKTMKGLAVLEGDIGTGKTTLARKLLDELEGKEYESALLVIVHSAITADWLLRKISIQMGVPDDIPGGKVEVISALYKRLMEIYQQGRRAVVLVDEAQMLASKDLMEEFRGLLNLEVDEGKLVTFILFGLPELNQVLALDEPLRQRIAMKYKLLPLDAERTAAYILHRLKVAGGKASLFTQEALQTVWKYSRGVPRLINVLCDNALLETYLRKQERVEQAIVEELAKDLDLRAVSDTNKK